MQQQTRLPRPSGRLLILGFIRPFPGHVVFLILLCWFFWHACPPPARSADRPFNRSANWGGTGLMEIPNARIMEDGVIRAGITQALPYRWYALGMGVLPGLELSGRLTQLTNVPVTTMIGYGSYKDKAFDIKYQILPESRWFPALAVGLQDFHGTKLFAAQYLVMSRQIYPFDFTVGIGRQRLAGLSMPLSKKISLLEDVGLFAGVQVALHNRLHFMAEYNPIEYQDDIRAPGRALPEGASLPVNVGLRAEILPGMDLGLSYQRGDTLGLSLHVQTLLGKPVLSRDPDPPLQVPVNRKPFAERDYKEMTLEISNAISEAGFSKVSVFTDGETLLAEFQNNKYRSETKAVGRVLRILLFHSPEDAKMLKVVAKRRGMAVLEVSVEPEHLQKYLFGEISDRIFRKLITVKFGDAGKSAEWGFEGTEAPRELDYNVGVKPDFQTYLNDPSGFFKFRPGIKPYISAGAWPGGLMHARLDLPFYSNIESSNRPLPGALRSDSWLYLDRDYTFERALVDQVFRFSDRTFARVTTGLFEHMYAGIGGEVLTFLGQGRFALGLETDFVRKRMPGTNFRFQDLNAYTLLANIYYRHPNPDITLRAKIGRFMAGDTGVMLEGSRRYETGVIVGGWYSFTDTDVFTDPYNRGYNEKGVFLSLPADMFSRKHSTNRFSYAIAPWSRDVAATPAHWQEVFGLITDLAPGLFGQNIKEIKE